MRGRLPGGMAALAVLAGAAALGYCYWRLPAAPARGADLAGWLSARRLRYGLGGVVSNITSVQSRGRVQVAVVSGADGRVAARLYQSASSAYDPRRHDATFLVADSPSPIAGLPPERIAYQSVLRTFGAPARVYHFSRYTVMIWNRNLLALLRHEV